MRADGTSGSVAGGKKVHLMVMRLLVKPDSPPTR